MEELANDTVALEVELKDDTAAREDELDDDIARLDDERTDETTKLDDTAELGDDQLKPFASRISWNAVSGLTTT
jgi:hypothetical protein